MRLLYLIILSSFFSLSQNLVQNPSFELTNSCEYEHSRFQFQVKGWSVPNTGTADIFNRCNTRPTTGVPRNFAGFQEPKSGDNYAGIYVFVFNDNRKNLEYSEYLQTKLITTLQKGKKYRLEFYVSLAEISNFSGIGLDAAFTNKEIKKRNPYGIREADFNNTNYELKSHILKSSSDLIDSKENWQKVTYEFIAKGFEEYLILGYFSPNRSLYHLHGEENIKLNDHIYYYVDEVKLTEVIEQVGEINFQDEIFNANETYVIKKLHFRTGSHEILDNQVEALDDLSTILLQNKDCKVTISGHTDSEGTLSLNQILSERRAESTKQYLILKGVNPKQILTRGFGFTKPLYDAAAKSENRRVEFVIDCK